MAVVLQPMQMPRDSAGVARVRSACFPAWPVTAEEVADAEARRPPTRWHEGWIAIDAGAITGCGFLEEPNIAGRPGRLRIRVLVDPACRRRGIGRSLHDRLLARAREAHADELVTEAQADDDGALRFLERGGYLEYHRRIESRLQLADVDAAAVARGIDRLTDAFFPTGVRIATYRQLRLAGPDAGRRLYELDATLWADVPFGLTGSVPTFEEYEALELADPDFLPQATFVALDGERWIGLCALARGPGCLLTSVTGVVRTWRGRGLARWMKLHATRSALESGAAEIRTFNDAVNDAILGLNRSLGFAQASVELRFRKEIE
jgi:mycothiol synthase